MLQAPRSPTGELIPGLELHRLVKAGFVAQGTTLEAHCRDVERYHPSNGYRALLGEWDGPKARRLRRRLAHAAGLLEAAS